MKRKSISYLKTLIVYYFAFTTLEIVLMIIACITILAIIKALWLMG